MAELGGNPDIRPEDHPRYRAAQAKVDEAHARSALTPWSLAPAAGIIAKADNLRPGDYATAGRPVFSLVSQDDLWVEANFKETDLTYVRPGQEADISVDTYPDAKFTAVVDSIGAATGAEFSALPPQNATGNWVKVVQRIPVRLRIEHVTGEARTTPPLRAGMSVVVDIDTEHHRDPAQLHPLRRRLGGRGVGLVTIAQPLTPTLSRKGGGGARLRSILPPREGRVRGAKRPITP